MIYSQLLDQYIKESGLSLAVIAKKLNDEKGIKIDRSYISKLRNNPKYPASEEINRALAEVLSGDPDALVTAAYYETAPEEVKKSLDKGTTLDKLFELILLNTDKEQQLTLEDLPEDVFAQLAQFSKLPSNRGIKLMIDNFRNLIKNRPDDFMEIYTKSPAFKASGSSADDVQRLKKIREEKGYSIEEIASLFDMTVNKYKVLENYGALKIPVVEMNDVNSVYEELVRVLSTYDKNDLLSFKAGLASESDTLTANESIVAYNPSGMIRVPVLGSIVAGEPIERLEHNEGYTLVDPEVLKGTQGFALRVKGDSMSGDNINDGFVVIVRAQSEVHPHEIAVVAVNGDEATLKRVRYLDSKAILTPSNPAFEQKVYDAKDIAIIGKVVEVKFWPK